jgi:hypothetical protein
VIAADCIADPPAATPLAGRRCAGQTAGIARALRDGSIIATDKEPIGLGKKLAA